MTEAIRRAAAWLNYGFGAGCNVRAISMRDGSTVVEVWATGAEMSRLCAVPVEGDRDVVMFWARVLGDTLRSYAGRTSILAGREVA